jgi:hypothetical protein
MTRMDIDATNPIVQLIQRQYLKHFELINLFINIQATKMKKVVIIIEANRTFKRVIYD